MDYLCAKFGDYILSRFGFNVRTERQRESEMRMNVILPSERIITARLFLSWLILSSQLPHLNKSFKVRSKLCVSLAFSLYLLCLYLRDGEA